MLNTRRSRQGGGGQYRSVCCLCRRLIDSHLPALSKRFSSTNAQISHVSDDRPDLVLRSYGRNRAFYVAARILLVLGLLVQHLFVVQGSVQAVTLPSGFISELVVGGLSAPTAIAFTNDGRMFIAQKSGSVRVVQNGVLLPTPFTDIASEVNNRGDRGLIGLAVHPDFPSVPYVYLLYTYDPLGVIADGEGARVSRLMRVTANAANTNIAQAASVSGSRVLLLGTNSTAAHNGNPTSYVDNDNVACQTAPGNYVQDCLPSDGGTHSVGALVFAADGALLVSNGDGTHWINGDTRPVRAIDVDSLAGKVLRIDPLTGEGYPDNPFYDGEPNSNRSKVLMLGFRNPFRIAVQPDTQKVYVGDVGWSTWEEINEGRGKNFGWPCYEGGAGTGAGAINGYNNLIQNAFAFNPVTQLRCDALYAQGANAVTPPVYAYNHSGAGGAIQAGAFYSGTGYPAAYIGALFIQDYNRNWIKYLTFDSNGTAVVHDFADNVTTSGGPVHMISGPDTNLYFVAYNQGTNASEVRRIRYVGAGNRAPTAGATSTPTNGSVPLSVAFSGVTSFDPDVDSLAYAWNFGNGLVGTGITATTVYTQPGAYTATLTVTDPSNATDTAQVVVVAGSSAPVLTIVNPAHDEFYNVGDAIVFNGTAFDAEDGDLSTQIDWEVLMHHNEHTHFGFYTLTGLGGSFVAPDHGGNVWMELCATVTDSTQLNSRVCRAFNPNTTQLAFHSQPEGMQLNYTGSSYFTPFTVSAIVSSTVDVIAPNPQLGFSFVNWSDGGAATHLIVAPANDQVITATYNAPPALYCAGNGGVTRDYWTGLPGSTIGTLTGFAGFPDSPTGSELLPFLEGPVNWGGSYGTHFQGWLCPPYSGTYQFWVAGDDQAQFWMSSDAGAANKSLQASVTIGTTPRNWTQNLSQQSAVVNLVAGQRYYVEVLHKESSGNDNVAVAWSGPGLRQQVITGVYLVPVTQTIEATSTDVPTDQPTATDEPTDQPTATAT